MTDVDCGGRPEKKRREPEQRRFRERAAEELHANRETASRESRRGCLSQETQCEPDACIAAHLIVSEEWRDTTGDRIRERIQRVVVHEGRDGGCERPSSDQTVAIVVAAEVILGLGPDRDTN